MYEKVTYRVSAPSPETSCAEAASKIPFGPLDLARVVAFKHSAALSFFQAGTMFPVLE